jgi:hypothetical protein
MRILALSRTMGLGILILKVRERERIYQIWRDFIKREYTYQGHTMK